MPYNDPEVVFVRLKNNKDVSVLHIGDVADLPERFSTSPTENFSDATYRNIYRTDERGSVQIVIHTNAPSFQSKAARSIAADMYLNFIPKFKENEQSHRQVFDAIVRRFAHNLSKFQKKFKEPFDRLMPDKARERPFSELQDEVKKRIDGNTSSAAHDVATMSLRATDLEAQIETLRILGGFAEPPKNLFPVNIKRAMYRLTNPFASDLAHKRVIAIIEIQESGTQSAKANISHQLFNVAIWQIFENACKYVLPNTIIRITMDMTPGRKKLYIRMTSVTIDPDEEVRIFEEHFRGRHAKKLTLPDDQQSNGIGLHIVQKALRFMKAKISVTNHGHIADVLDVPYSDHTFTIEFCQS